MEQSLSLEASQEIPAFYVTQRLFTVFTTASHRPYPQPDQPNPSFPISSLKYSF